MRSLVIAICLAGLLLYCALLKKAPRENWSYLKLLDPSLRVMDDPPQLLKLASGFEAQRGKGSESSAETTFATRFEAFRALLLLQRERFKVSLPAPVGSTTWKGTADSSCPARV